MKKLTVLIILLLMIGYYANVRYKEENIVIDNDVILGSNGESINEENSLNKVSIQYKIESDKFIFETELVALKHVTRCGFSADNIDNVRNMLTPKLYNNSITEKQDDAINKLIDGCLDWYDYLADKDENLESLLIDKMHSKKIVMEKFAFGEVSDSSILAAKENLNNEDPDIASTALMHSLNYDLQLRDYILDRISFQDENYFSNNSMQIAGMYSCEISRNCGLDSDSTLVSCLINKNFCGLSFYDSMNKLYSPSQITEMQNILGIIIQKIKLED